MEKQGRDKVAVYALHEREPGSLSCFFDAMLTWRSGFFWYGFFWYGFFWYESFRFVFFRLYGHGFHDRIQSFALIHAEFHNIFNRTFKNGTQNADGMCRDILIILQAIQLTGAEAVGFHKPVLADILFFHSFP